MTNELRMVPHRALFWRGVLCCGVLLGFTAVCQASPQAAIPAPPQRFTLLRGAHILGPSIEMTAAEANCAVTGNGDSAGVRCRPIGVTQKNAYTYNITLIAQPDGSAYVIACRIGLISNTWCKSLAEGRVLRGTLAAGHFTVMDGDKPHVYLVLRTAQIGPLDVDQPASPAPPPKVASTAPPASPTAAPVSAPTAGEPPPARAVADAPAAPADPPGECVSANAALNANAACVSFTSDPAGADIYVDGKFVGDTPSEMPLPAGPHQIRIEGAQRKSWTRTLEATAAGTITIRAVLEPAGPK